MHRVGRSVLLLGSVACNTGLKPHLSTLGAAVSPVGVRSLPAARPQGSDDAASHSARYWRARKRQVPAPVPAKAVCRPPVVPVPVPAVPGLAVGSFGLRLPSQLRPPPCPPPAAMTARAAVTSPARALPARVLPAAAVWGGAPAPHDTHKYNPSDYARMRTNGMNELETVMSSRRDMRKVRNESRSAK